MWTKALLELIEQWNKYVKRMMLNSDPL
jgi:hypothetical protein